MTFGRFRSVERIDALTAEYEAIAADCREKLEAKREAEAKAFAASPTGVITALAMANELATARKRCERVLANTRRLERKAGLPVTPSRSFKGLALDALTSLEENYHEAAKVAVVAVVKTETPKLVMAKTAVEPTQIDAAHIALVESYKSGLASLRKLDAREANRLFHAKPERISERNLRVLVESIEAATQAHETAKLEAEREAKRQRHAEAQRLRKEYTDLQRSGRAHQPFGKWAEMRGFKAA